MARKDVYCCECQSQPCVCGKLLLAALIAITTLGFAGYGVYKLF